jgi:hypothetical protein
MTAGNTSNKERPGHGPAIPIDGHTFAPLQAAMPPPPTGRIRLLDEARRALRIPMSSDREVLQLWGVPADGQLVVYPVDEPTRVAEFALLRVLKRDGSRLVERARRSRLHLKELPNALWVVYGSIATATSGDLVLETISIAPAFNDQLTLDGDTPHGITGQLLRLLSPPRILAAAAERLLSNGYWLDQAHDRGTAPPMSTTQRAVLQRIDEARPQHARISDDWLARFAAAYLTLYHRGVRNPRAQLAHRFGLTTIQVRDRTNQARKRGYLTPGSRGRVGAEPGPRLLEHGWQPPKPPDVV